jgi:hypothetical protein
VSQNNYGQSARILRQAGFVPLPRLWVKAEDMPHIRNIAHRYSDEVNRLRHSMNQALSHIYDDRHDTEPQGNPIEDKDAAWAMFERERSNR